MKKAVVVDFDKTLVNVNSFELFYKEMVRFSIRKYDLPLLWFLTYEIGIRKARIITHAELKRRLLVFINDKDLSRFLNEFVRTLCEHVNNDVLSISQKYKEEGYRIYLSTAAPELYVLPFLSKLKFAFDEVICSPMPIPNVEWQENLNENKKQNTVSCLVRKGDELAVLITDHKDDLPLLRIKKEKNILVNPNKDSLQVIKLEQIPYELL